MIADHFAYRRTRFGVDPDSIIQAIIQEFTLRQGTGGATPDELGLISLLAVS